MASTSVIVASDAEGSYSPQQEVDYFLCYAKSGKAHNVAKDAKEWFLNQGLSIWDRYSNEIHPTPPPPNGDLERHNNCVNACRIFVSKAVLLFVDFDWLSNPECLFDYDLAQLQNLTSSRPVIFPIFCEDLSCCTDDFTNALIGGIKSNLPPIETWNQPSGVTQEDIFHHIHYKLGSILLKHLRNLPKLPEYASQESRRASRASAIMNELLLPPLEQLPSGKWVGVLLGAGRSKIGGKLHGGGAGRYPMDCLLRMRPRLGAAAGSAAAEADAFHGHGRDDVGLFMINGVRKGAKISFDQTYSDLEKCQQVPFTVHFEGNCHGTAISGKWTIQDEDDDASGYWALWPERPEENRFWDHYVLYFKSQQSQNKPKVFESSANATQSSVASGIRSATSGIVGSSSSSSISGSSSNGGLTNGVARKPMMGAAIINRRITEDLSSLKTSSNADEVTSGLNVALKKSPKTTSAESLDSQTKKVHFAEESQQQQQQKPAQIEQNHFEQHQQQQQHRPPAAPSFGVRLSFNTEKLVGGTAAVASDATLSKPKSMMTTSMPNVADITATILTAEELEKLTPTPTISSQGDSSSMTSSMIELSTSSHQQPVSTSSNMSSSMIEMSSTTEHLPQQAPQQPQQPPQPTASLAAPVLALQPPTPKLSRPQSTPDPQELKIAPQPQSIVSSATSMTSSTSFTTKPPSPPAKVTSPKPVVVDVQKRESYTSSRSSSSSSLERMIPIEREKSPRGSVTTLTREKSPIVIVQEKSALESRPHEAPLVIREETTSFMANKRGASPIRIVREDAATGTAAAASTAAASTAAGQKSPRIKEITVVPWFDAATEKSHSGGEAIEQMAASFSAAPVPTTPVSPVISIPVMQQLPIESKLENGGVEENGLGGGGGGGGGGGPMKRRNKKKKKNSYQTEEVTTTTSATSTKTTSREGNVSIPVVRGGGASASVQASRGVSADGTIEVPIIKASTNNVAHGANSQLQIVSVGGGESSNRSEVSKEVEIPVIQTTESSNKITSSNSHACARRGGGGGRGGSGGLFGDGDPFFANMPNMMGIGGGGGGGGGIFMPPMMSFQGPDAVTTQHQFSDSMNYTDSKDGASAEVQAQTQTSQTSSTNQSVDPATGQSTSSSFFSTNYSSSSSTNNNFLNDGFGAGGGIMGGGGGGGRLGFPLTGGDIFFGNAPGLGLRMSPLSVTIPAEDGAVPIIHSPASIVSTEETKGNDSGPVVSEIFD